MPEVVLVQCNLINNQYQQNSEVFETFKTKKSYAYLLTSETEFGEIITFTDQNNRPY